MGGILKQNVTEISSAQNDFPIKLLHLRVAAYCRIIAEQEAQTSCIKFKERREAII